VIAPSAGKQSRVERFTVIFLGTRGEAKVHSRRHRRHSSLLVEGAQARIMINCGTDWLGQLKRIAPTTVVLTHAHADHAEGLAAGAAPCPVYTTKETWD
jgi:phosphoribosyl 1,2-cyclic phosphodiesterase